MEAIHCLSFRENYLVYCSKMTSSKGSKRKEHVHSIERSKSSKSI